MVFLGITLPRRRDGLPKGGHSFHHAFQVSQVCVPFHQRRRVVPQTGRNILFSGSRHGEPASEGMTQGMPRHSL